MRRTTPRTSLTARLAVAAVGASVLVGLTGLPSHAATITATRPSATVVASHGLGGLLGRGSLTPAAGLARLHGGALRASAVVAPPAAVDLTAYAAPVGNQGRLGSCVAWAIDYAMLGWYANKQDHAGAPYAPMYAYSQMQAKYGWHDQGGYPSDAYAIAADQGIDTQADYPQGTADWQTLPTAAQHAKAAAHKTAGAAFLYQSYSSPPGAGARTAISTAVAANHPVALSIPVYGAFFGLNATSHTMGLSQVTGASYGGHEVLVLGYDATGVRIQNSWGTGWGERGFANLTWDFVQRYTFDASIMTGFVSALAPAPAPVVSGLTPATGKATGGTRFTVRGSGFPAGVTVSVGGKPATGVQVVDPTTLTAVTPAGGPGAAVVTVQTPTSVATGAASFLYTPVPVLTSLTPGSGPALGGTTVTLRGSGLTGALAVTFGGRPGLSLTVLSDSVLTVVTPALPAGAAVVQVRGLNDAISTAALSFTAVDAPKISSVTRPTGRAGDTVTIAGADLLTTTGVFFGDTPGMVVSVSGTQIRVIAPKHAVGPVAVRVVTGGGTAANGAFRYTA